VGNENWGCGGNMSPEYYANEYKRYATYVKHLGGNRLQRIACGPSGGNLKWTEVLMREAGKRMDGLALHYYFGSGLKKQLATEGTEEDWISLMARTVKLDSIIREHSAIMDQYDPQKKVALVVDEWGTWHLVEPGTNPGFLYQQNTIRDAITAGVALNIFNRHSDRVRMANIAQTVNVLQAMVLTDKEKMLLTPTYHVFEMYTVHHDATLLPAELATPDYVLGTNRVPALDVSASRAADGRMHVTLCNLNPNEAVELKATVSGAQARSLAGRVLTAPALNAHNTFETPDALRPVAFSACALTAEGFTATLPAKSVVALELVP
jgi:alpha-N-arabinofuranosidase